MKEIVYTLFKENKEWKEYILCVIFVIISREKHMIFLLIMGMVQSDPSNSKLGRMAQLYFLQNRKKV